MNQTHLQAASWATEVANAIEAQGDARAFDVPLLLRDAAHHIRRLTAVSADLLAALEAVLAEAPEPDRLDYEYRDALASARAAPAKAKGED